jgi:hypothetical protein
MLSAFAIAATGTLLGRRGVHFDLIIETEYRSEKLKTLYDSSCTGITTVAIEFLVVVACNGSFMPEQEGKVTGSCNLLRAHNSRSNSG